MSGVLSVLILLGLVLFVVLVRWRGTGGPATSAEPASFAGNSQKVTHIIEYADAFGEVTVRGISVRRVSQKADGILYVEAFCLLRTEDRTFRADRILALKEWPAGKDFLNPQIYFYHWPGKRVQAPRAAPKAPAPVRKAAEPPAGHQKVMDHARRGLRVLIWLARADKDLSSPEEEVMLAWVQYRAAFQQGGMLEWSRSTALDWVRSEKVVFADVEREISGMGQAEKVHLLETLEDLMLADGEKCRLEAGRAKRIAALLPAR